jgi:hypothetical protein
MTLKAFIKQENQMHAMFGRMGLKPGPLYPEDTDLLLDRHKAELADRLASALSPENLCCDGELRGAPLRAKTKLLQGAKADLVAMGVTHEWW